MVGRTTSAFAKKENVCCPPPLLRVSDLVLSELVPVHLWPFYYCFPTPSVSPVLSSFLRLSLQGCQQQRALPLPLFLCAFVCAAWRVRPPRCGAAWCWLQRHARRHTHTHTRACICAQRRVHACACARHGCFLRTPPPPDRLSVLCLHPLPPSSPSLSPSPPCLCTTSASNDN